MANIVYVGDVHSNYKKLEDVLSQLPDNSFVVFLGDLFDSREPGSSDVSAAKVLSMVLDLRERQRCVVLQSNHQHKLLRLLQGNKVIVNDSLKETVASLTSQFSEGFLLHWLLDLPYGFSTDVGGVTYKAAHAYYVPGMNELMPSKYAKQIALYGLQADNKRVHWWNMPEHDHGFVRVAGHYHEVHIGESAIVLDGGCGEPGGALLAYMPSTGMIYQNVGECY